jgi:uncharacterized protein (DUF305 family)
MMKQKLRLIAVGVLLLVSGLGIGYVVRGDDVPAEDSADVGFARDMSDHHLQAVEMATLLYDRTTNTELRFLAYDILTTQQGQVGTMSGWLDLWGYSKNSSEPRMAWMGMPMSGRMPGMATNEQIDALNVAEGESAEVLFMQLMIPHHESGVHMAQPAMLNAEQPAVQTLAFRMMQAQESEIAYMEKWLSDRGYERTQQ